MKCAMTQMPSVLVISKEFEMSAHQEQTRLFHGMPADHALWDLVGTISWSEAL